MSFDWRQIPVNLIDGLPERDLPKSAKKALRKARKYKESEDVAVGPSLELSADDQIAKQPLTFNNCHFHIDGTKLEGSDLAGKDKPTLTGLISERLGALVVEQDLKNPSSPHQEQDTRVRFIS